MENSDGYKVAFPKESYAVPFRDCFSELNGADSFKHLQHNHSDVWSASISRSSGLFLEKATFSFLHITHGVINGMPGSIDRFEAIIYPANPKIPALFIMTDFTDVEDSDAYIVLYTDLIIQDGESRDAEKELFSRAAESVCAQHGHNFGELNAFIQGRSTFGGTAGACGLMGFFEQKDIPFIDDVVGMAIPTYRTIIELHAQDRMREDDYSRMYASRARLVEWMLVESLGTRIMRENSIPIAVIEASSFPPMVKY
jgi:hypothetical protein